MMTRFLIVFACLVVFIAGACTATPLPDNPALDKPVTLAVKGEALSDIMDMLEKQTGVSLQVARDIADQKATIFVDQKPLREVMEGLATLFKFYWREKTLSGKKIYEIWEDEKTRREREGQEGIEKAWKAVLAGLDKNVKNPNEINEFGQQTGVVLQLCRSFSSQTEKDFLSGMNLYFDSHSPEKEWKLSEETSRALIKGLSSLGHLNSEELMPNENNAINLQLFAIAKETDVCINASVRYRHGIGSAAGGNMSYTFPLIGKRVQNFLPPPENHLPQEFPESITSLKCSFDNKELVDEAGISGQSASDSDIYINRSDLLAILHRKLGVQIISDHYSKWSKCRAQKDISLKDAISLVDSKDTIGHQVNIYDSRVFSGCDGKYVYLREKDVRGSDLMETPNRLLRPLQDVYAKWGCLGLDQLAQMRQLTENQCDGLRHNSFFLRLSDRNEEYWGGGPSRLYGLLTAGQRKEAFAGGTSVRRLSQKQRIALYEILYNPNKYPGPLVGIYNKQGWRVDKPESPPGFTNSEPLYFAIQEESREDRFYYRYKTAELTSYYSQEAVKAGSVEEAWKKVQAEHPGAGKDNLIWQQNVKYTYTVSYADSGAPGAPPSTPQWLASVCMRVPYSKVEVSSK